MPKVNKNKQILCKHTIFIYKIFVFLSKKINI